MAIKTKRRVNMASIGCSCSMPGVWQAVAHNPGAAVIFHSPKGCAHVTSNMDLSSIYRSLGKKNKMLPAYTAPLVVSGLAEEHSIFGGAEQLRSCIDHVMQRYQPEYVVIANSCVSGIIGDDIDSVAAEAEAVWQKPIITTAASGFLSGHYQGAYHDTARVLLQRFATRQEKIPRSVTVLGDRDGRYGTDTQEIKRLLDYFSLHIHCCFPSCATLAEIQRVSASTLSVLTVGSPNAAQYGISLGLEMEKNYDVPFFNQTYPIGWDGIQNWVLALGAFLGQEERAVIALKEEKKRLNASLVTIRAALQGVKTVLFIGRPLLYLQPDWILNLLKLSGTSLQAIVLSEGLTVIQQEGLRQVFEQKVAVPIFSAVDCDSRSFEAQLWLATEELSEVAETQFILPMLPPVGVEGIVTILERMMRMRSKRKGGIIFG